MVYSPQKGYFVAVFEDITERKKAEEKLKESKERYRSVFNQAINAMVLVDVATSEIIKFNDRLHKNLGYTREEFEKLKLSDFEIIESPEEIKKHTEKILRDKSDVFETKHKTKSDKIIDVLVHAELVTLGGKKVIQAIFEDITERKRAEEQIKASLKEKEVLLKEIHHRVKNNLQIISSLLSLQSPYLKDGQASEMFRESQNRVKSMALIHERLYQSKYLGEIDFAEYVRKLTVDLFHSYGVDSSAIQLVLNVSDILLDIDTAIPCGLIINELVSNSLKHAFPAGEKGEVCVDFSSDNDNNFKLVVSDNGVGLPEDLDFRNTESLGLQLVNALINQLDGAIELDKSGGTAFKITLGDV